MFYRTDFSQIYRLSFKHISAPLCEISKHSNENFLRYTDFKILFGRGMRSTKAIYFIFKRNLSFTIIHHPAKFH